jgi:hypothetical protein
MVNIFKAAVLSAGVAAVTLAIAAPAAAQTPPSYALQPQSRIEGRIASIPGKYTIEVNDNNGYVDNVSLHDGTIINPTGIRLAPGFPVTIYGEANGSTFVANEIDTPYRYVAYYGAPYYWGAYPSYGLSLGFGFGFHGGHRWR